jgi:predicted XRE-type DNA-binding protein
MIVKKIKGNMQETLLEIKDELYKNLCDKLQVLYDAGYDQAEIATFLEIGQPKTSNILNRKKISITLEKLITLSLMLGIDIDIKIKGEKLKFSTDILELLV